MKKILLIGELNHIIGTLNKYLSTKFQTQMCMDNFEMVKSMRKVFGPDMVLVSLIGCNQMDVRILDYFCDRYPQMPVLFVGTTEECEVYQEKYESNHFEYLIRPTTLGMLLQKCENMLNMEEENETEDSQEKIEENVQSKKRIFSSG